MNKLTAYFLILFSASTLAQQLSDDDLVRYIESRVESGEYVGMIVGFVDGDRTYVQAFGSTTRGGDSLPDERTIFEISSVSKTFTATLLAASVIEGELVLDVPANDFLPAEAQLASFEGKDVTLLDLVSHQSGLPYMPADIEPADGPNPYAGTTTDDLVSSINAFEPGSAAGQGYSYSAFGYGTLAYVLSLSYDTSFEDLITHRITEPLGMSDTVFALDEEQASRLATGYTQEGEVAVPLEQGVFRAAGSMYSSLHDLMLWLRANMNENDSPLGEAVHLTHEPRNALGTVGLAWHRTEGHNDRSQFGTAHGYRAYVGFLDDGSKGAVVLANTKANVADIGQRLLLEADLGE